MCKYCKNLKRIKDLEENRLFKIINSWRRRDYQACHLLSCCLRYINNPNNSYDDFSKLGLEKAIVEFINADWIGK